MNRAQPGACCASTNVHAVSLDYISSSCDSIRASRCRAASDAAADPTVRERCQVTTNAFQDQTLKSRDLAYVVHPLARPQQLAALGPVVAVSAMGAEVTLSDGRTMIDGPAAMWCVNVGHGRRELIDAATQQLET